MTNIYVPPYERKGNGIDTNKIVPIYFTRADDLVRRWATGGSNRIEVITGSPLIGKLYVETGQSIDDDSIRSNWFVVGHEYRYFGYNNTESYRGEFIEGQTDKDATLTVEFENNGKRRSDWDQTVDHCQYLKWLDLLLEDINSHFVSVDNMCRLGKIASS